MAAAYGADITLLGITVSKSPVLAGRVAEMICLSSKVTIYNAFVAVTAIHTTEAIFRTGIARHC